MLPKHLSYEIPVNFSITFPSSSCLYKSLLLRVPMHCYPLGYLSSTPRSSFAIYGIITDDSQAEALKKEIQSEVDAIMNTFETK